MLLLSSLEDFFLLTTTPTGMAIARIKITMPTPIRIFFHFFFFIFIFALQIVPLQIRAALVSETVLGRENLAGALALGMLLVMIVLMSGYALLQRRARRWQR